MNVMPNSYTGSGTLGKGEVECSIHSDGTSFFIYNNNLSIIPPDVSYLGERLGERGVEPRIGPKASRIGCRIDDFRPRHQ